MRIAMIGHKRIPSREGGVEVVVEELSQRMVEKGQTVYAYNRKGKNIADKSLSIKKQKEYQGIHIITIPTINIKSLDAFLYSFFGTIRALFGHYDIIHYHAEGPSAMIFLAHIFHKKTVATIHGLDWQRAKWGRLATKYLKFGEKIAAKYADEVIVLSRNVQEYFLKTYNRKTVFIQNGVSLPNLKLSDIILKKYGLTENSYFLFLSRIVPEKGLDYLIDAYQKLNTEKYLVIAGGSSHSNDYIEHIKKKIQGNKHIIMTGFVQGKELRELYSNCYAYVLPSDLEGMSISLLEALSYGRQCVISDISENIEVAGDLAYTFKKSDSEDLRQVLSRLLEHGWKYDSDTMRRRCVQRYDWNQVVNEYLKVYESVSR